MRSRLSLVWVLGLILSLSACGGSGGGNGSEGDDRAPDEASCPTGDCGPGDAPAPLACGGVTDATCPGGYRCVDDPADDCDMANGDDCNGICLVGGELPRCGANESPCPDGYVCADDPNDTCDGGPEVDCPGVCEPEISGECSADEDCPPLAIECSICPDGTVTCPLSVCDHGRCTVALKGCPDMFHCGAGGMECPAGFECVAVDGECDPLTDPDCGGFCRPIDRLRCNGVAGIVCPEGYVCVDDPNDDCDPNAGGADCGGICEPETSGGCTTDRDCPPLRAPCSVCSDGSSACPYSVCENGQCNVVLAPCPTPLTCGEDGAGCPPGYVCVEVPDERCDPTTGISCSGTCVRDEMPRPCGSFAGDSCPEGYVCIDDPNDDCDPNAGGADCPGFCNASTPSEECRSDGECPHILAPCTECPDGSYACPNSYCDAGKCRVVFESCTDPGFCGGIAGFPCPPGYTCIDNPNDDCDPSRGGADCGGMCVREEEPRPCGGFAGETCPAGFECADDPNDDCDPLNGGADCPGICRPAPAPACMSDAECPRIDAPCRVCPDGMVACPQSSCENGECRLEFGGCRED
jgi:hypothetical protein